GSLSYGPPVRLRLLSTLPHGNAVTFDYEVMACLDADFHRADKMPLGRTDPGLRRDDNALKSVGSGGSQFAYIACTRRRNCWVRSSFGLPNSASGGPASTTRPPSMNTTRSANWRAKAISCVTSSMLIEVVSPSSRNTSSTSPTISGSSAEVTSSN